jgi:hypothetical protein
VYAAAEAVDLAHSELMQSTAEAAVANADTTADHGAAATSLVEAQRSLTEATDGFVVEARRDLGAD